MAAAGMCVGVMVALWLLSRLKSLALPWPKLWLRRGGCRHWRALCPRVEFTPSPATSLSRGAPVSCSAGCSKRIVARYLDEKCPTALKLCAPRASCR